MGTLTTLAATALFATAVPAYAHTHLKESMPADGSTVTTSPPQIVLMFTEAARVTAMSIKKDGGAEQKIAPLPATTSVHVAVSAPKLTKGHYTITWRVAGEDGHVMNGTFQFSIDDQAAPGKPAHEEHAAHDGH